MGAARSRSMERLGFPPHVFATAIHSDLVLFDSAADRYLALPDALSEVDGAGVDVGAAGSTLVTEAAEVLVGAGMMIADSDVAQGIVSLATPTRMLPIAIARSGAGASDVARVAAAVVRTRRRLRRGYHAGTLRAPAAVHLDLRARRLQTRCIACAKRAS